MHRRNGSTACFVILSLIALVSDTSSFTLLPAATKSVGGSCGLKSSSTNNNEGQLSSVQKGQEKKLEMSSIKGADEIRQIDIQERTKRAMLAEAAEDRIFELVDELDLLVKRNGGIDNLSDDARAEAVELAKQTNALQIQYDDLVSGKPSQLLDMDSS